MRKQRQPPMNPDERQFPPLKATVNKNGVLIECQSLKEAYALAGWDRRAGGDRRVEDRSAAYRSSRKATWAFIY
jgi:hypothetical protein